MLGVRWMKVFSTSCRSSVLEPFGHQIAVMINEATAAIEFDRGVAVGDFEMKGVRAVFDRGGFREVEKLPGYSPPAMGWLDEEFIDPRAFAVILQTEIEADDEIGDRRVFIAGEEDESIGRILQQLQKIFSHDGFVRRLVPRVVELHVAH